MPRRLEPTWTTTASGRPSFEVFAATPALVAWVMGRSDAWGFAVVTAPVMGFDQVIVELERDGARLHLGWDNWSGFYLFADTPEGDEHVRDIADRITPLLDTPDFQEFVHEW